MVITKEQIERFFDQHCTKEEAERIARYLEENPQVLRKYIMQDWTEADEQATLPADTSNQMLSAIRKELFPVRKLAITRSLTKRYLPWAAAAVLILIAGLVWWRPRNAQRPAIASAATIKDTVVRLAAVYRVRVNSTSNTQVIPLPDGSVASLSVNSTLRYEEPFAGNKRELVLEGQASFKVTKDQARPFIVSAGPILTTVLGTEFRVSENDKGVTVRLYNGKVRLQPKDGVLKGWHDNIVLLPGEQMKYVASGDLVEVSGFEKVRQPVRPLRAAQPHPEAVEPGDKDDALVFNHRRLPEVLDQLAARYHTPIIYDRKLIGDMYFSGTVLTSDSLLTILEVITNMNELTIVQETNGFSIQKNIP
jgi:transmembrane sensor